MKLLCLFFSLTSLLSLSTQAAKSSFIYCSEGSPSAFNPQVTTDGTSNNAAAHTIYEKLVDFKYGTTDIIPSLATSWEVSKDNINYTFNLRKNVQFHKTKYFSPTRNFNADDVLFSFNRQRLKDHPYHKIGGVTYDYFMGMEMHKLIKDIKKINDHKVQITLVKPESPFLANLAMSFMSILSKEYADKLLKEGKAENLDQMPIGTGPFVYSKYIKDTLIRFKKNEQYWSQPAKIKNLIFSITPDASVRFQKLKAGECDLIIEPPVEDLTAMKNDKSINLLQGAGLNVGYLAMNTKKKPFDNVLVRRAINHALNKDSYINAIYLGNAIVAKNPLPPTIWSYNKKVNDYSYSPKKARELLKKAGLEKGFETEIWTLPVTRPYNPKGKKMGELMQADLAKVGIKAKLITYDWPTYLKKSRQGEHSLIQLGWTGDNGDPDNFLNVLLGCGSVDVGSNVARWCHQEFDSLITRAKTLTDVKARTKLYKKAQVVFKENAPWVPIAHSVIFRAMNKKVKGYKIDPLGGDIFKTIEIQK